MVELFLIIGLLAFLFMALEGEGGAGEGQGGAAGGAGNAAPGQPSGTLPPGATQASVDFAASITPKDEIKMCHGDKEFMAVYLDARHPMHELAVRRMTLLHEKAYGTELAGDFAAEAGVTEADLLRGQEKLKQMENENEGRKLLAKAKAGHFSDDDIEAATSGGHVHALAESVAAELRGLGRMTPEIQKELDGVVALAKGQAAAGNKETMTWARDMTQYIRAVVKEGKKLGAYR